MMIKIEMTGPSFRGAKELLVPPREVTLRGFEFFLFEPIKVLECVKLKIHLDGIVLETEGEIVKCIEQTPWWVLVFRWKKMYRCGIQMPDWTLEEQSIFFKFLHTYQ